MLIGQTVMAPDSDPFAVYYTPWLARRGNTFTAVLEVLQASGAFQIEMQVQTKNVEQSDSSLTLLGSVITITSAGTTTAVRTGCLELVRYEFVVSGVNAPRWIHFRSTALQWLAN